MEERMIQISENAFEALSGIEVKPGQCMRILVKGYGWGGPVFGIALEEQREHDKVVEYENLKFVVEEELVEIFGGFFIDYANSWFRKGFLIRPQRGGSSC